MNWKWHWYCTAEERGIKFGNLHRYKWQAKLAGRLHSLIHGHAYGKIHIGCSGKVGSNE